jgi:hypothetical protein
MAGHRKNSTNAKPLSQAERKAFVEGLKKTATGKTRRGLDLIDFREPTAKERAFANQLEERRHGKKAA